MSANFTEINCMKTGVIVLVIISAIVLISFLIYRSKIDRKELEEKLNNNFEDLKDKRDKNRD